MPASPTKRPMEDYVDKKTKVEAAVKRLLTSLDVDPKDPNFKETPRRVAAWLMEKFTSPMAVEATLAEYADKTFPSRHDNMIVQTGIRVYGLCPHHLLPIEYDVAIGYIPEDRVIGLSKLARTAELILGQVGIQEDRTDELARCLSQALRVEDIAVVAQARHDCMICRGVRMHTSETTTSAMLGKFRHDDNGTKSEFLALVYHKNGR